MMDSINEQLYPEDPFSSVNDEFAAGEQAFADAARYLFPETVSAPLEWSETEYGAMEESETGFYEDAEDGVTVLDLGASYSAPSDTFAELASAQLSAYTPYAAPPEPEAFSGISVEPVSLEPNHFGGIPPVAEPSLSAEASFEPLTPQPSAFNQAEPEAMLPPPSTREAAPAEALPQATFPAETIQEAWTPAPADWGAEPFGPSAFTETELTGAEIAETPVTAPYAEPVIWTSDTVSSSGASSEDAYESLMGSISETISWEAPIGSAMEDSAAEWNAFAPLPEAQLPPSPVPEGDSWNVSPMDTGWRADELAVARSQSESNAFPMPESILELMPEVISEAAWDSGPEPLHQSGSASLPEPASESAPALQTEADFYATAFTLNELGELVPVHDDVESLPGLEPPPFNPSAQIQPEVAFVPPQAGIGSITEPVMESWNVPGADAAVADASGVTNQADLVPSQPMLAKSAGLSPNLSLVQPPDLSPASHSPGMVSHSGPLPPLPQPVMPPATPVQPPAPALEAPSMPAFSPEQFLVGARARFVPPTPPAADVTLPLSASHPVAPQAPVAPMQPPSQPQPLPSSPETAHAPQHNPVSQTTRPAQPQAVDESKIIRPKPLTRKTPVISAPHPQSPLEDQWYGGEQLGDKANAFAQPASSLPAVSAVEMKLTLGNLEVLGICQLLPEKRLLVVQHDGVYALMGQVGQEKSGLSVLKLFEQNPLAYQHTFTAVEEGKAGGHGMYVTQVGTWHAIISTFQDKISLHTELG